MRTFTIKFMIVSALIITTSLLYLLLYVKATLVEVIQTILAILTIILVVYSLLSDKSEIEIRPSQKTVT